MNYSAINDLIPGVILFACIQGVILMVVLLKLKSGNRLGHKILACLVFFFTFNLFGDLLDKFDYLSPTADELSFLDFLLMVVGLTVAPLIYLYTDVITIKKRQQLNQKFWMHFLPSGIFLVSYCLLTSLYFVKLGYLKNNHSTNFMILFAIGLLFFLGQVFIYLIACFFKLKRHRQNIKAYFSATERINLNWLRNILLGFTTLYGLMWFSIIFSESLGVEAQMDVFLTLVMVLLVYLLSYMGMQQADIFGKEVQAFEQNQSNFKPQEPINPIIEQTKNLNQQSPKQKVEQTTTTKKPDIEVQQPALIKTSIKKSQTTEDETNTTDKKTQITKPTTNDVEEEQTKSEPNNDAKKTPKKYQKSALDKETSKLLFKDLLDYMAEKKPYLENNISLSGLAEQINLSPNYLSQIINEQSENNFFDFINRYRVNHVKTLLQAQITDGKNSNMLDIALASGFNSKSAFYNAFKKYEGMTPSQYKKSI